MTASSVLRPFEQLIHEIRDDDGFIGRTSDFLVGTQILPGDRVVGILTTLDSDDLEPSGVIGQTNYATVYALPIRGVFIGDGAIHADQRQVSVDLLSKMPFSSDEEEYVFNKYAFIFMKETVFDNLVKKMGSKHLEYKSGDKEDIFENFCLRYSTLIETVNDARGRRHEDMDEENLEKLYREQSNKKTIYLRNESFRNIPDWDVFDVSSMFDEEGGIHSRFLTENIVFRLEEATYAETVGILTQLVDLRMFLHACEVTSKVIAPSPMKPLLEALDVLKIDHENDTYRILFEIMEEESHQFL